MASRTPSPIQVVKSGYDPNKVYVEASDRQGHSERVQVRIPPQVEVMMLQAINDNPAYQRSTSAFIRDAIVHRLAYLQKNPGATIDPVQFHLEVMRLEMESARELDLRVKGDIERFSQLVDQCVETEDWSTLNLFIDQFQIMLDTMELSPGHRQMIEDAIADAREQMAETEAIARRRRRRS